jgi:hypothetical protein
MAKNEKIVKYFIKAKINKRFPFILSKIIISIDILVLKNDFFSFDLTGVMIIDSIENKKKNIIFYIMFLF